MKYTFIATFTLSLSCCAHAMENAIENVVTKNEQPTKALAQEIEQLNAQIQSIEKQDVSQAHLDELYAQLRAKSADHDARTKYLESLE